MDTIIAWMGLAALVVVLLIFFFRKRIGELRSAAWLFTIGALILLTEHPQFSILYALQAVYPEGQALVLIPHARIHFLIAGVYSALALFLIVYLAWAHLSQGSRSAGFALLVVTLIGGGLDLSAGGFLYPHGSPLYRWLGVEKAEEFGWQFLYMYIIA